MDNIQSIKYLLSAKKDEQWGITINTVGTQTIEKDYVSYPPAEKHPDAFFFNVNIRSRFNENLDLEEIAGDRYTQPKLENI